jgi:hypothetical protein
MIAGKLGFSPVEQHRGSETVDPGSEEAASILRRYDAYLEASRFSRILSSSLARRGFPSSEVSRP